MARTPLMQFFKTLSADINHCELRDLSIADVLAERKAALSRRQFVAGNRLRRLEAKSFDFVNSSV